MRASTVSMARNISVPSVPKYPRRTWPWKVWTTTGAPRPGEERRGPADRPRLGRVGVDDVRTELADEVRELERGKRVSKGRELPREPRQGHDLDPGTLGHERHRLLAAADVAGHEGRLVPTVGESAGEVGDVERGPSDVQARDHAQHPDRPARGRSAHRGRD